MSMWRRSALLVVALATSACSVPYPVLRNAGPFVVPPSPSHDPLEAGLGVQVVTQPPPGCLFLGLATGVGGATRDEIGGDARYGAYRAQALVALRNAVGAVGGTHTIVDAEVVFTKRSGVTDVLLRGPALSCPR